MHRRTQTWTVFGVLALVGLLWPGVSAQAFQRVTHAHFTATVGPAPKPGKTVTVTVRATVDDGWHVYSVVPSSGGPFATVLDAAGPGWKAVGATSEDAPKRLRDPNFGVDVGYHEHTATFQQRYKVSKAVAKPTITVHYQTCSDKVCLPPADAVLPLTVSSAPPLAPAKAALPARTVPNTHKSGGAGGVGGLGLFLLGAFGAGLLTLVTPCVFPLIPITLTNFVKQADGDKRKLVRLSAGYAAGIVILYVGLGVLVTALAGAAGLGRLGQNPWVNLLIFVLFIVFALSFFETISIPLPVNLTALQESGRKHGGVVGLGLLGIAFVLASFTCVAPFLGTLLVASAGGRLLLPTLGLLVYALAFASPFFVFALFPQWISHIPKGGVWLARVKATLGFVELAAALKFLSNADVYWNWGAFTQPVLLALWAVICVCAALYQTGTLRFGLVAEAETEAQRHQVSWTRRAFAGVFMAAALYLFWGLSGRDIRPLQTFLPRSGYGGVAAAPEGLPWLDKYPEALALAKAQHKPLLIDFTGNFCTNCRYNEANVFPSSSVQAQMANFVRVKLYTDGPHDGANQALEQDKFGTVALPLYGILDPQTERPVTQIAGTQTAGVFTRFLAQARAPAVASR